MDVFKLAFETIVAGLLAFVWLGVATYLLSPDFLTGGVQPPVISEQVAAVCNSSLVKIPRE